MEITNPAAILYDAYTVSQLKHIADFNNVAYRKNAKKLDVAKAIVEQAGDSYKIPEVLPLAKTIRRSRLESLRGKEYLNHRDAHRHRMKEQYEAALGEAAKDDPDYQRISRYITDTPKPETTSNQKVAVYSNRNISWDEVGRLTKGYNFVKESEAEKWLRLKGVRKATPEEVASYFDI